MVSVVPDDFAAIDHFPLAWRWTDPRWKVLPPRVLTQVRPLAGAKAHELNNRGFRRLDGSRMRRDQFSQSIEFDDSGNEDSVLARAWLKGLPIEGNPPVFLCWSGDLAVLTHWWIFCDYWDDFCYPLEAVLIWPSSEEWLLFHHPEERLYFGMAAAEPTAPADGGRDAGH